MTKPPISADEASRLRALDEYRILDTSPEQAFDDITQLASQICGTPIALVSLVDRARQWFKSRVGLLVTENSRDVSFCAHAILQKELFIVPDTLNDERFASNPLVTSDPQIRFYAAAPLCSPEGFGLGTLCVIDHVPRQLSTGQQGSLRILGRQVMTQLELRRNPSKLESALDALKRTEESLRGENLFRRLLITQAAEGICVCHETANHPYIGFTEWNDRMTEITGYTLEGINRLGWYQAMYPDTVVQARAVERMAQMRQGKDLLGEEWEITRADGEKRLLSISTSRLQSNDGVVHVLALMQDITQRRESEQQVRNSEARYRSLTGTASDAIITINEDSTILFVNRAAETMFGYADTEMLGQSLTMLMPEYLRHIHRTGIKRYLDTGQKHISWAATELPGLHKSGQEIPLELSFGESIEHNKRVFTGIARDISERKRTEEVRRHLEEQLRQSTKMEAVGQLAGGIAHDFNNMLTGITGYGELLLARLDPTSLLRNDVEEILKAGERAASLTQQLLAFSRRQILDPRVIDLNDLVTNMEKLLRRLIGEDVELVTFLSPELAPVKADSSRIEQVILNLALNARDAMPQGGKLTIETSNAELDENYARQHLGAQPGAYVLLAVSDTGIGMDAETRSRIFEPYFTTKEQGKGSGLGLSMVYGIVKQSEGYVMVYSEPERGTTLKVYLPQAKEPLKKPGDVNARLRAAGGWETILLVEDEEVVLRLVRSILQKEGYTVLEAKSGAEAIALSEQQAGAIHLLVTDVVMPRMSGRQLAQRLTDARPELRVLYMSGYTDDAIVHHGVLDPGLAFIQKPFTPEALASKVREILDTGQ